MICRACDYYSVEGRKNSTVFPVILIFRNYMLYITSWNGATCCIKCLGFRLVNCTWRLIKGRKERPDQVCRQLNFLNEYCRELMISFAQKKFSRAQTVLSEFSSDETLWSRLKWNLFFSTITKSLMWRKTERGWKHSEFQKKSEIQCAHHVE